MAGALRKRNRTRTASWASTSYLVPQARVPWVTQRGTILRQERERESHWPLHMISEQPVRRDEEVSRFFGKLTSLLPPRRDRALCYSGIEGIRGRHPSLWSSSRAAWSGDVGHPLRKCVRRLILLQYNKQSRLSHLPATCSHLCIATPILLTSSSLSSFSY